jgi:hypothetical protein
MQKSKFELVCVGNYPMCSVTWHEVLFNHPAKKIGIISHQLLPKEKRREKRINYVTFEVPEEEICSYRRYVCVKPQTFEYKWFRMEAGQFIDLGEVIGTTSYAELYLNEFVRDGYSIIGSDETEIVKKFGTYTQCYSDYLKLVA